MSMELITTTVDHHYHHYMLTLISSKLNLSSSLQLRFSSTLTTALSSTLSSHASPLSIQNDSRKTYPPLHSLFSTCKSMDQLKQIHSQAILKGPSTYPSVCFKIVDLCCKSGWGCMNYARQVFDTILEPNVFIWNTMIKGCSRINCPKFAVSLYIEMLEKNVKPDDYTFPFLLKGFTPDIVLECGGGIHCHVCKFGFDSNGSVKNALIHMYSLCGQIDIARGVFNLSLKCDVITWNCMISGYNRSKQFDESRKLFNEMEETSVVPTSATLVSLLSACSKLKDLDAGIRVHRCIQDHKIEPNLVLNNALVDLYVSCGDMDTGLAVFKTMNTRDVISWTAIVKGFLSAGQVDLAREYFELMPQKDSVSWTAMIDGYLRLNRFKEVLMLFRDMQDAKVEPDEFTMVSVLTACANLGALELGEWIKAYIDKNNIKNDVYIGNALIDMYFKCGNVEKAVEVFKVMLRRDKFTWTAMIVGFAVNGNGKEAVDMFCKMLSASIKPDRICYIGVLCACAHAGMVEEGRNFFTSMTIQRGIEPEIEHYGCMIDLLGRAGRLTEAYKVIENMPMKPNSVVWGALLGACRIHKDLEMAEIAATELLHLEPGNGAVCILLCNIYAACNKWDNLRELRKMMADREIEKTAGCSFIEINGFIHEFVAWDQSHFRSEEVYSKLEMMREDMRTAGYTPDTSEVFPGLGEEYKEGALKFSLISGMNIICMENADVKSEYFSEGYVEANVSVIA